MSKNHAYPLAVQRAALRETDGDGEPRLAFADSSAWRHLLHYMLLASHLPAYMAVSRTPLETALLALTQEAAQFGTPAALCKLLERVPAALSASQPPAPLHATLAWMVAQLRQAAQEVLRLQQALLAPGVPAEERRTGLHALGKQALHARTPSAPLLEGLGASKPPLLAAHAALVLAAQHSGSELQQQQQALGRQQAGIELLEGQVARLGLFGAHKKAALQGQLQSLRSDFAMRTAAAEQLRTQLASVNQLVASGAWLETAIDALLHWLADLRAAWSALGSGVSQLAADASDLQLADDDWLATRLTSREALPLWQKVLAATQAFLQDAVHDAGAAGGQP